MRNICYDISFVVQFFILSNQKFLHFLSGKIEVGAGAGAKIKETLEPELQPKLHNFGSTTLLSIQMLMLVLGS